MFDKISSKRLKSILVFKYTMQLIGIPLIIGVIALIVFLSLRFLSMGFMTQLMELFVKNIIYSATYIMLHGLYIFYLGMQYFL